MTVLGSADPEAMASDAARRLLERLCEVQAEGPVPQVVLTGGRIADAIHREVARLSPGFPVDWARVELWWGDERYVPRSSPDRNAGQARAALLDHVPVSAELVHEMPASDEGYPDVDAAAAAYGERVHDHGGGRFDLVMLGMGPDGHVASLFPGFPQLDVEDRIAVGVTGSPKPPPERISLTFPALERTRSVWFVVTGSDKADAVARAVGGADPHEVPAARPRGTDETLWLLDAAAASRL